jgi:hypothetical protein
MRRVAAALLGAGLLTGALLGTSPAGAVPSKVGPLPDTSLTPGARDENVTQANVTQTICVPGYTKSVRNVSAKTKTKVYSEYKVSRKDRSRYTIDHLIPVELGGSNALDNLWPEPKNGDRGSRSKDAVENTLHSVVCAGTVSLADAQAAIAVDWTTAGTTITSTTTSMTTTTTATMAPPPPPTTAAPPPAPAPPPPAPAPPGGGATALCNDGTYSYAANHQGACSHHGGVALFYK